MNKEISAGFFACTCDTEGEKREKRPFVKSFPFFLKWPWIENTFVVYEQSFYSKRKQIQFKKSYSRMPYL